MHRQATIKIISLTLLLAGIFIFFASNIFAQGLPSPQGCTSNADCAPVTEYCDLPAPPLIGPGNCKNILSIEDADGIGAADPAGDGIGAADPRTSGGQTSNADFVKRIPLLNPIDNKTYCTVGADNKAVCSTSGIQLISQIANNIIKTLLGLVGIFAMIGFIWGGVTWMTSYGDTAKIERGKKMMIWGVVGLIVIFSSYAIANYIFEAIGATGAATTATPSS